MTCIRRAALAFAVILAGLAAGHVARADRVDLMTNDGAMRLDISRNGEVDGFYPKLDGTMRGRATADGDITGMWTQPRSDHPCRERRAGTYAWGTFYISGVYSRRPVGYWGYCGEQANRDWGLRRN